MNDWCDRHVDAINQPERPIPSGRLPGRSGLYVAIAATALSLLYAAMLGRLVLVAAALALLSGVGIQRAAAAAQDQRLVGAGG